MSLSSAFDRLLMVVGGALVVAMLVTVTAGIVSRALGEPLSWTDEGAGYLMVWLACIGWMLATRHRAHIRIRYFQDKLSRTPWRGTERVLQAGVGLTGGVIAWYAVHLVRVNADIEAMALPVSAAWLYVPLIPAGLTTLVQALLEVARPVRPGEENAP